MTQEMEFHPIANIFPLLDGKEFKEFAENIRTYGLLEPIWTHDGQIIDGRNRYRACQQTGVEPKFREWEGNGDLVQFVLSLNLHRRHLNESQRGMVAARIANLSRGGDRKSDEFKGSLEPLINQTTAAGMMNVSRETVKRSKKVVEDGCDDLVKAVDKGEIAVRPAAQIAALPKEEQREAVEQIRGKQRQPRAPKPDYVERWGARNGIPVPLVRTFELDKENLERAANNLVEFLSTEQIKHLIELLEEAINV